jgi:predicted nuclease of predicted toxin-antitoxin system
LAAAFLLDEHMDPMLARVLRQRGIQAVSMQEWREGTYISKSDEEILEAAEHDALTLLTYDVHSIPALLTSLAEIGTPHAGVVLISRGTVAPQDLSGLARAVEHLVLDAGDSDWRNRLLFLPKP